MYKNKGNNGTTFVI